MSSAVSFRFAVVMCVTISYSNIVYKEEEEGTQKTENVLSKSLKIKFGNTLAAFMVHGSRLKMILSLSDDSSIKVLQDFTNLKLTINYYEP